VRPALDVIAHALGIATPVNALFLVGFAFTTIILFSINVFLRFGPLLAATLRQVRGYEPADANGGVPMEAVRGQAEHTEEVARVVRLWQPREELEPAGGKR